MTCSLQISGGRLQYTTISIEPYILMYSLQPSCGSLTYTKAPMLQCVAVCCSVLQCVVLSSNIHQHSVCCSVLQCVAVCCSVLCYLLTYTNILKEPYILMYSLQASCLRIYLFFAGFRGNLTYTQAHKTAPFTTKTHA